MQRICDFIAKWMGVLVLMVAALSLIVPESLAWIGTWVINPMLGIIMFGWNTFGVLLFGPAVATYRFFDTLNKIERKLNE